MPQALAENFLSVVAALQQDARQDAAALRNTLKHYGFALEDAEDWPAILELLSRTAPAQLYRAALETPNEVRLNAAAAAKHQADILAMLQRDMHLQFRTGRLEAAAAASVHRESLGQDDGPLTGALRSTAKQLFEVQLRPDAGGQAP